MIDQLLDMFHFAVEKLSHGNTMSAGFVSVWLLTVAGVLLRKVPRLIYWKIRRKIIVNLAIYLTSPPDAVQYRAFLRWVDKLPSSKYDRNRKTQFNASGECVLTMGFGFHWFIYNGRYYWFNRREIDSQGVDFQKEKITIFTYGFSLAPINAVIEAFRVIPDQDALKIFVPAQSHRDGWELSASISTEHHPEPIIDDSILAEVFARIEEFLAEEEWYRSKGIPYKCTFLLMGPPGTGKTTIVREVAIKHSLPIYTANLGTVHSREFAIATARFKRGIMLFDDMDASANLTRRDVESVEGTTPTRVSSQATSLSEFLNFLDGAVPLDNAIVFMCTNYPENLDAAVHRPGRVDYKVTVGPMQPETIRASIARMYNVNYEGELNPTIAGALHGLFQRNKRSFETFIDEYRRYHNGELNLLGLDYNGAKNAIDDTVR